MRPALLPFAAGHVVQAVSVKVVAAGLKDVWHIVHRFDHSPAGCYLSARQIAAKVGMSEATVQTYLAELRQLRLLARLARGWAATIPTHCVPRVARPGDAEVQACARQLEGVLAGRGSGSSLTPVGVRVGLASGAESDSGQTKVGFPSDSPGGTGSDPSPTIPAQTRPKSVGPASDADGRRSRRTAVGVDLEKKTPAASGGGAHALEHQQPEQKRADREQQLAADPVLRAACEKLERRRREAKP